MIHAMKLAIILFYSFVFLYGDISPKKLNPEMMLDSIKVLMDSEPNIALKIGFEILAENSIQVPDTIISFTNLMIGTILYKQGFPAQALDYHVRALDYYISNGRFLETGWFHNNMGNIYFHQKLFEKALEKYRIAQNIFQKTGVLYAEATVVNNIALVAIEQNDFKKAMNLFNEALELRMKYKEDPFHIAHSYKYIGDLYLHQNLTEEALDYYQKILDIGIIDGDNNTKGMSLQAIGDIYLNMGEINTALEYFNLAESNYISDYNPLYLVQLYYRLSQIYQREENVDSALIYINKAIPISELHGLIDINVKLLSQIINIYESNNNIYKTIPYYRKLNKLRESSYVDELQQAMTQSEIKLNLFDNKRKLVEKEIRLKIAKQQLILVSIIGLLLVLVIWILYKRYKHSNVLSKHQENNYAQEIKIERLNSKQKENEIKTKRNELITKTMYIQQKNDLIGKFTKNLKYNISLLKNDKDRKQFLLMISSLDEMQNSEDNWIEFEKQFKETYPDYFSKLTQLYTNLTPVDLKMCSYLKMNMNTKDISILTGMTIRAIEIRRHRLRKKLNISKDKNLNSFLYSVSLD
jgi:tetratricopeptide (TPR) repeat protein